MENLPPDTVISMIGSFLAVAVLLAELGRRIGLIVFPRGLPVYAAGLEGWRWLFRRTLPIHPVIGGTLIGLAPLPVPEFMGGDLWGRAVWFALAGALSLPIHGMITRRIE